MVQQADTAKEENTILCYLTHDLLKARFGVKLLLKHKKIKNIKQHDRALKEVTKQKDAARHSLRKAKREGAGTERVNTLAGILLSLLRVHSRLKLLQYVELHLMRPRWLKISAINVFESIPKICWMRIAHPRPFLVLITVCSWLLLKLLNQMYTSLKLHQASWLPTPPLPQDQMSVSPVSFVELVDVIQRSSSSLTLFPYDQIPYLVQRKVHFGWQTAAMKLIGKSSALSDPTTTGNFRPIALTPTIIKLL